MYSFIFPSSPPGALIDVAPGYATAFLSSYRQKVRTTCTRASHVCTTAVLTNYQGICRRNWPRCHAQQAPTETDTTSVISSPTNSLLKFAIDTSNSENDFNTLWRAFRHYCGELQPLRR